MRRFWPEEDDVPAPTFCHRAPGVPGCTRHELREASALSEAFTPGDGLFYTEVRDGAGILPAGFSTAAKTSVSIYRAFSSPRLKPSFKPAQSYSDRGPASQSGRLRGKPDPPEGERLLAGLDREYVPKDRARECRQS